MLNKVRDDSAGVTTTLQLARGSITSPPRSIPTGSFQSFERSSTPKSPDSKSRQTGMSLLNSVGVLELLEQDDRPTFIIDLTNRENFVPGAPLQIVFANSILKAYEDLMEFVSGKVDLESPGIAVTNAFPEFKAWALSFVRNNESLDVCLPSFSYGGATWTCSTLRKRLRLISASNLASIPSSVSSNGALSSSSFLSKRGRGQSLANITRSPLQLESEPDDYFGTATSLTASAAISPLPVNLIVPKEEPKLKEEPMPENYSPPRQAMKAALVNTRLTFNLRQDTVQLV